MNDILFDYYLPDQRIAVTVVKPKLQRNAVKCLACGITIESTNRHDFQTCGCPNGTLVDGGLDYQRWGAVDIALVELLAEYSPPARWVAYTEPCPMCLGSGKHTQMGGTDPCHNCIGGKQRHTITVPCPNIDSWGDPCEGNYEIGQSAWRKCNCDGERGKPGRITVGTGTIQLLEVRSDLEADWLDTFVYIDNADDMVDAYLVVDDTLTHLPDITAEPGDYLAIAYLEADDE